MGRQLMSAAVERMMADGFTDATLWVLDSNARARGFYAKAGWTPDGATKTDETPGFPITEIRYRRHFGAKPPGVDATLAPPDGADGTSTPQGERPR